VQSTKRCGQDQKFAATVLDKLLCDKPKKARVRDKFGAVPLHHAAKGDKFAAAHVEALVKHFPGGSCDWSFT